jgi:hypothetical protein
MDRTPPDIVLQAPATAPEFHFTVVALVHDASGVSKVFVTVDGEIVAGRIEPHYVFQLETRGHDMEVCIVADDVLGNSARKCAIVKVPVTCVSDETCEPDEYCAREEVGDCDGPGMCLPFDPSSVCVLIYAPVCGCDGKTYNNTCEARRRHGVNVAHIGTCEDGPPAPHPAAP